MTKEKWELQGKLGKIQTQLARETRRMIPNWKAQEELKRQEIEVLKKLHSLGTYA